MAKRNETTSKRVARLAAKTLASKRSTRTQRSIAGSALTQRVRRGK